MVKWYWGEVGDTLAPLDTTECTPIPGTWNHFGPVGVEWTRHNQLFGPNPESSRDLQMGKLRLREAVRSTWPSSPSPSFISWDTDPAGVGPRSWQDKGKARADLRVLTPLSSCQGERWFSTCAQGTSGTCGLQQGRALGLNLTLKAGLAESEAGQIPHFSSLPGVRERTGVHLGLALSCRQALECGLCLPAPSTEPPQPQD